MSGSGPGRGRPGIGLRCDAGPSTGVGHLVRCLALAQELAHRGVPVHLLGQVSGVAWLRDLMDELELEPLAVPAPAAGLAEVAAGLGLSAVVLDGYHLDPGSGEALRARGIVVLALVDGDFGAGQSADLYLDQNLGAMPPPGLAEAGVALTGLDHVLLRDQVLRRRPAAPPERRGERGSRPARVLAVFGGTDPERAALLIPGLALATGAPVDLTVVAVDGQVRDELERLPATTDQRVHVIPPDPDLPGLLVEADLVLSAAGSSVWELLCLGAPSALVCVTPNQQEGYQRVVRAGLAAPLGTVQELRGSGAARATATAVLRDLLTDPGRRAQLSVGGWRAVDGLGRRRVVDAVLELVRRRTAVV